MTRKIGFFTGIFLFLALTYSLFAQADLDDGRGVFVDDRPYTTVAETDTLRLLVNAESLTFIVEDRRSGKLWTSFVPATEPEYQNANRVWQRNMGSLFIFTIVDLDDDKAKKRNLNLLSLEREVVTTSLPDGVRFDVYFIDYQIGLSVEVTIKDDALEVRIPEDSIIEETTVSFSAVTLLPYFGYAKSYDSGYMVIPDGCGAIYNYKLTESGTRATEKKVSWYAYAPEKVSFEEYLEIEEDNTNTAYLPIFGVKIGDDAFIASVDEGDSDAYINFFESGLSIDLSRMNVEFLIRHAYELFMSEIAVETALAGQNVVPVRYDQERIPVDRLIRYEFLTGADATYSGMARAYRRHLQDQGILDDSMLTGDIPLGLGIFGGIIEDRLLFDKYVAMTTFSQAGTILDALVAKDISRIYANFIGWSKRGYGKFPRIWPPDRGLGGRSGLEKLVKSVDKDVIKLYLQIDPVHAIRGNGRFNQRNDVVKQRTKLAVRSERGDEYFLNPKEAFERVTTVVRKLEKYGVDGVTYEAIGDILFYDYNTRAPAGRHETLDVWNEMTALSNSILGSSAIIRGNVRQVDAVELIFELPMETSGYFVIDEAIPFYQMVLHGSVYYTTDAENLFYDTQRQILRWIETGAVPYYVLTYKRSEELAYTDYNHLFTSYYVDWIDVAAERYHEFNREFGDFFNLEMTDHLKLTESVIRVTYSDGSRVYVNYGEAPESVEGITVEGMDYRVIRD